MNLAKLSVSSSMATNTVKSENLVAINTSNNQVFLSNIKSATTVSIYSITGSLIKTIETSSDTNFQLESGLWIASIKSEEGTKSLKFIVN